MEGCHGVPCNRLRLKIPTTWFKLKKDAGYLIYSVHEMIYDL
jgi:hypothetical protein